jgi:hypothetical protein
MNLSFTKLSKHKMIFLRLTGVSINDFEELVTLIRAEWDLLELKKKKHGRNSHAKYLEDKVLCLLMYYRTYITHEFLGCLFDLHNSNICRLFKKLEPLLAKKVTISKDRNLTPDNILELIADITEQPTQRPKNKQKSHILVRENATL